MGWRTGDIYIAPGETVRIGFSWDAPGDRGAQWVMGHPIPGEPSTPLATERVAKSVSCRASFVSSDGEYGCADPDTAYWEYYADITNDGFEGCRFQLEGGGV